MKSKWIRSPCWDGLWILSGIPIGAVLTGLMGWLPATVMIFWAVLITQTGHLIAPMALAWSHGDFRELMRNRSIKFIGMPIAILSLSLIVGVIAGQKIPNLKFDPIRFSLSAGPTTIAQLKNPFMAMVAIYAVWNAYHFGKQAFGVLSIYRRKQGGYGPSQRLMDLWYCCTVVWATMGMPCVPRILAAAHNLTGWPPVAYHSVIVGRAPFASSLAQRPYLPFLGDIQWIYLGVSLCLVGMMLIREWFGPRSLPRAIFILTDGFGMILVFHLGLWAFAIIALNHWLVAIGLASHVYANHKGKSPWPFALAVMAAGFALFCLLFVDLRKLPSVGLTAAALYFTVAAVGLRLGLGFIHFLYDRWLYKFSDPRVRETIGADIFSVSHDTSPRLEVVNA